MEPAETIPLAGDPTGKPPMYAGDPTVVVALRSIIVLASKSNGLVKMLVAGLYPGRPVTIGLKTGFMTIEN
jgi:hypothetical protein